jgi:hypothetical protein
MMSSELYSWIENPEVLNDATLGKLEETLDEYPYFQTLLLLYQKNLQRVQHPLYSATLAKTALFCVDRKKLFYLINRENYAVFIKDDEEEKSAQCDRTQALIDSFFNTMGEEMKSGDVVFTNSGIDMISSDYLLYLESIGQKNSETTEESSEKNLLKHHDIIDQFIEKADLNASLSLSDNELSINNEQDAYISDNDIDDDKFLTETLAGIYIRQKKYEQALTIIKRLSLNFPKKSAYFADQIHFLEYLIINEKNKK